MFPNGGRLFASAWLVSLIATDLGISEPTVRMHVANILTKLHLADRTKAAIFALQKRIVPLDDQSTTAQKKDRK
jgi:NarL family two-component system response regulator LiaR